MKCKTTRKSAVIGVTYKYRRSDKEFILKEIVGCRYVFECGHWCTDLVFMDLYPQSLLKL